VREAIRARGDRLSRVLVVSDAREAPTMDALARFAADHGAPVERVARSVLDRLARGVSHQGAMAFADELELTRLEDVAIDDSALVVALDELQDPQNFGAVIRASVAMRASAVLWPEHRSAPLSPAAFRASAGAVEHATLCRVTSLPAALRRLQERGATVVGLDRAGSVALADVDLRKGVVLVVGAEGKGLRSSVKAACTALAHLPMPGPIDSLNASTAAAIGLYEVVRQRG
jgi:23S rRNA (guanosine2251-2'-O)-methyltransferase